jgi:hypothetical protein
MLWRAKKRRIVPKPKIRLFSLKLLRSSSIVISGVSSSTQRNVVL